MREVEERSLSFKDIGFSLIPDQYFNGAGVFFHVKRENISQEKINNTASDPIGLLIETVSFGPLS